MALTLRFNFTAIFNRTEHANPVFANSASPAMKNASNVLLTGFGRK